MDEGAGEDIVGDVLADLVVVVGESFAVGEHDEREPPRRYLQVHRGKAGAPVAEVPDQARAAVVVTYQPRPCASGSPAFERNGVHARACIASPRNASRSTAASYFARSRTVDSSPADAQKSAGG